MLKSYFKWLSIFFLPAWIFVSFFASQIIIRAIIWLLSVLNISLTSINSAVFNTTVAAFVYLITLSISIGLPWFIQKRRTTKSEIGLTRLPSWTDILITPAGLIIYFLLTSVCIIIATKIIPGFDIKQAQDVGFSQLSSRFEYVLAFTTLVIIAPIAEEILFRGYLFGKLKKYIPIWVAILVTSVTFGFIHGAWNLAVDTFALSIILCLLRQLTGNIWASILLHMLKNSIAFFVLFIYPTLLATL